MNKTYTRQEINLRDTIVHQTVPTYRAGGIQTFNSLSVEALKQLLELGLADPIEKQNEAPTIREFFHFMSKFPRFKAIGYTVSPERDDTRISIEGLRCDAREEPEELTLEEVVAFTNKFHDADEFEITKNYARCWYD